MDPTSGGAEQRAEFERAAVPLLKPLYAAASRLARGSDEAQDLVQETYLRAYRTFGNFVPGTNVKAWLVTILYSVFTNRYRKQRRQPLQVSVDTVEEHLLLASRPGEHAPPLEERSAEEVERALARLPEEFRTAVLMVDVEGLTYEEAAAALGCPLGTVRSRLSRARKSLCADLGEYALKAGYVRGA